MRNRRVRCSPCAQTSPITAPTTPHATRPHISGQKCRVRCSPCAQNPPPHRTNYTPRDETTHFRAKPSRQVQPGAQNPPPSKTRATAVMLFVSVGTVVSYISGTFADYARLVRNARPVRNARRGPACALTVDARKFVVALRILLTRPCSTFWARGVYFGTSFRGFHLLRRRLIYPCGSMQNICAWCGLKSVHEHIHPSTCGRTSIWLPRPRYSRRSF